MGAGVLYGRSGRWVVEGSGVTWELGKGQVIPSCPQIGSRVDVADPTTDDLSDEIEESLLKAKPKVRRCYHCLTTDNSEELDLCGSFYSEAVLGPKGDEEGEKVEVERPAVWTKFPALIQEYTRIASHTDTMDW